MQNCIVILDSGVGGLSVLKEMYKTLPMFNYVYFADTKNLPYGEKTKKELLRITINNVKKLIEEYDPLIIVFGCNTIGMSIFNEVQNNFSSIKMFALTPNITTTLKNNFKNILLLGTTKTISNVSKTNTYNANKTRIILCKMPLLATKVENYIQTPQIIVPYLRSRLNNYLYADCIILGCSHYYFVKNQIKSLFKNAKIIDGVKNLVCEVKTYLKNKKSCFTSNNSQNAEIKLIISSSTKTLNTYNQIIKNIIKNKQKRVD